MELSREQIESFMSPYLGGGWRHDEVELERVSYHPNRITGWLHVRDYYMASDGIFHLTVPVAFIYIAQLAIVYACVEHQLTSKPGEAYLRGIDLECRRKINATENIPLVLSLKSRRYVKAGVYYVGEIDVADGAFVGEGRFIIPLPPGHVRV